jgi:peptide/nickel transport system permease protein
VVLGIGQWVTYARIVRAQTCRFARRSSWRPRARWATPRLIISDHPAQHHRPSYRRRLLNVASVILAEASLSLLGPRRPPETPTWGSMLAQSGTSSSPTSGGSPSSPASPSC